ncbi:MAG: sodium:solute symporter, partial [Rhodothermales bacterium]|nr:sodium:solute symporter [Rhodothermales bacterium]
ALIGSGILVIIQFAIFLLVGTFIWAAGHAGSELASDEIFAAFVVDHLPPGLSGLVIAGILAAAMSTVSSSLNSLASATTHDFYSAIARTDDPQRLLSFGRWATVAWAAVLAIGALAFRSDQPVVELALSIASITYGSLLGVYILGGWSSRSRQIDALVSITGSAVFMLFVVLAKPGVFADLAWPWYVPLGTTVALLLGGLSSLVSARIR